jgi:hypothetical protein
MEYAVIYMQRYFSMYSTVQSVALPASLGFSPWLYLFKHKVVGDPLHWVPRFKLYNARDRGNAFIPP